LNLTNAHSYSAARPCITHRVHHFVNTTCNNTVFSYTTICVMAPPKKTELPIAAQPQIARLYQAAATLGDTTPAQIARRLNTSVQSVGNWASRGISKEAALAAQNTYGFDANWLLGENDVARSLTAADNRKPPLGSTNNPDYVRFPLLAGFAGAGRGDYVGSHPEIVNSIEVTREWASQKLGAVPLEAVRVITARGDSMRGQYNDGDLVFVDSRIQTFDADSAYVYRWNSRVQIKRLQFIGHNRVRVLSKNLDYPILDVNLDELEIGGRALAVWTLKEF
jgi:phage repressor protein C with HTH and peptisase S24 domain